MLRLATLAAAVAALALVVVGVLFPGSGPAGRADAKTADHHALRCSSKERHPHFMNYPALHRNLVPNAPARLIICRYSGLNGRDPQTLVGSRRLARGSRLHRIVQLFDTLERPPHEPISCPADWGKEVVVHFRYGRLPDAWVRQDETGCGYATNGQLTRWAFSRQGSRLLHLLHRLTASR